MASFIYCKVYGIDGIHFVKLEREKFTFKWLNENYAKSKPKIEKLLAYDDFSGDRILLSNEDEFKLMVDMMDDIGANMVKLYVTKIKKKPASEGKYKNRELLRGGSFGIFNSQNLRGFNRVGKTSNPEKTVSKTLVNAHLLHVNLKQFNPLNVNEIHAKWDKGSINVFCPGRIGHPDSNFVFDKQIFEHLKEEPQKCAWIDKEKSLAYIFHFETEKDAVEFYEKVLEMKE
ncbi:hypothetical protein niasHS_013320 [Heterodera schachtii]|uniref:PB1 domain-containing protein n=1 Tax=Heterodera schachtii TaxID=97005 RepID=A0ABD2IDI1_HETSC